MSNTVVLAGGWYDYFMLIGTAAATLIGLMFVAVSITAGYMTEELRPGLSSFVSPTIAHFATTLVACLVISIPVGATNSGRSNKPLADAKFAM